MIRQNNFIIYFLSFIYLFRNIYSIDTLSEWKDNSQILPDPTGRQASTIDSYSLFNVTNTQLYLGTKDGQSYFFVNNAIYKNTYPNDVKYIDSPLVVYNNAYYFCSSSLMKLGSNGLEKIAMPYQISSLYNVNYQLKCFYNVGNDNTHSIVVIFLNTQYGFSYILETQSWYDQQIISLPGTILAVNAYDMNNMQKPILQLIYKTNNNEYIWPFYSYENKMFHIIHNFNLTMLDTKKQLSFYSVTKISFITWEDELIFTYEPNEQKFRFYRVDRGRGVLELYAGKNYLRFFNDYEIIFMDFIENSPLMYYSIKSAKDNTYYIGVADLQYSIIVYNIKSESNEKVIYDTGYFHRGAGFVCYFKGGTQYKICPFVFQGGYNCIFYSSQGYKLRMHNTTEGLFENSFVDNCNDGVTLGNYCLDKCPMGYFLGENGCIMCKEEEFYYIATKKCQEGCNNYPHDTSVCYNCDQGGLYYYQNDCVDKCQKVYGEIDSSNTKNCKSCLEQGKVFDTVDNKCIASCPQQSEYNSYTGQCTQCKRANKYYLRNQGKCVDSCPEYYVANKLNNECELCSGNQIYFKGKCVPACEEGYDIVSKTVDGTEFKMCRNCLEYNLFYHEHQCLETCPLRHVANEKKYCKLCSENSPNEKYFFKDTCVETCEAGYENKVNPNDAKDFYCYYCKDDNLFYNHDKKCKSSCEDKGFHYEENNICYYCYEINQYYQSGICVQRCSEGYGESNTTHECYYCHNNDTYYYDHTCWPSCPKNYAWNETDNICTFCKDRNMFFHDDKCYNECPLRHLHDSDNICYLCTEKYKLEKRYYFKDTCVASCDAGYQETQNPRDSNDYYCYYCKDDNLFYNHKKKCVDKCEEKSFFYEENNICYFCNETGKYLQNGKCQDECSVGYGEDRKLKECIYCLDNGTYYYDHFCRPKCPEKYAWNETNICTYCKDFNMFFHDNKCYQQCPLRHLYDNENLCYLCSERSTTNKYYFNDTCVNTCIDGYQDTQNQTDLADYYCYYCKEAGLFFDHNRKCSKTCEEKAFHHEENNICYYCKEINQYYQKNKCVPRCYEGYGESNTTYECYYCHDNSTYYYDHTCWPKCPNYYAWNTTDNICTNCYQKLGLYYQDTRCVKSCNRDYRINEIEKICESCPTDTPFFFEGDCFDKCPNYTRIEGNGDHYCQHCNEKYSYLDGQCVSHCDKPYVTWLYQDEMKICRTCEEINSTFYQAGYCVTNCSDHSYKIGESDCKYCYCANPDDVCNDQSNKCICADPNHNYGYSCEFYSPEDIHLKKMSIESLYDLSIKSNTTFFKYRLNYSNIKDEETIQCLKTNNFSLKWKLYLEGAELTNNKNYKKFFTTGTNEDIFGINKNLLSYYKNNVSLDIINNADNKTIISDSILVKIIQLEENIRIQVNLGGSLNQKPMETKFILTTFDFRNNKQGLFFAQYLFIDYYNEEIPLTTYQEVVNQFTSKAPTTKRFALNLKNDRGEIKKVTSINEIPIAGDIKLKSIENIFQLDVSKTEKIYELLSYFYNNKNNLTDDDYKIIFDEFINDRLSEIINENGYLNETIIDASGNNQTLYLEPKTIFALINYIVVNQKKILKEDEKKIETILSTLDIIFTHLFNLTDYQKTLSESDSLSLFRTIDQLMDILTKHTNHTLIKKHSMDILDKFTKYLSLKTYPAETIKILGKKISMFSFHFGKYQKILSVPSEYYVLDENNENKITIAEKKFKDYGDYAYEDYGINENLCDINGTNVLCMNSENYHKFQNALKNNSINATDLALNFYIIKSFEGINYNFSAKFSLFNVKTKEYIENNLNDSSIFYDIEFPFDKPDENEVSSNLVKLNSKNKNNNNAKSFFNYRIWERNILTLSPNYSNITCVPKNHLYKEEYYCLTHFNYETKKIVCSCNILDDIMIMDNYYIANYYKNIQFKRNEYKLINKVNLSIFYTALIILLIPNLIYLSCDIYRDNKKLKSRNDELENVGNERKKKYESIKKYYNISVCGFTFYLSFKKYPFFAGFTIYNYHYPKYIKHLVVITGILLGVVAPVVPYYFFTPFGKRQVFIDKRDLFSNDNDIHSIEVDANYHFQSGIFSILGLIITDIFIYIFGKILSFDKAEEEYWEDIKTVFEDYVYYEIKNDVLLGNNWNSIKSRMIAYYLLCGKYLMKKNKKKFMKQNSQLYNYLQYISKNKNIQNPNNVGETFDDARKFSEIDRLFPSVRGNNESMFGSVNTFIDYDKRDINSNEANYIKALPNQGAFEMTSSSKNDKSLLENDERRNSKVKINPKMEKKIDEIGGLFNDDDESKLIDDENHINIENENENVVINTNENYINDNSRMGSIASMEGGLENRGVSKPRTKSFEQLITSLRETKTDLFNIYPKNICYLPASKINHYEKIKHKYIYQVKHKEINETEIDIGSNANNDNSYSHLKIGYEINYSFFPTHAFNTISNKKIFSNSISSVIFLTFIVGLMFFLILGSTIILFKALLNEYEYFIIKTWIGPLIGLMTVGNFVIYYLKTFFSAFLLFHFYNVRKKGCFTRFLFFLFVDKTMISIYKVRNFITKYKREFDYL